MKDRTWFEMRDIRRRRLADAVWIPLRASDEIEEVGEHGFEGHLREFFGAGSLAVHLEQREKAKKLDWMSLGISRDHAGCVEDGNYVSADSYRDYSGEEIGIHLVVVQGGNGTDPAEWHLHQDFVVTLGLIRENDKWLRPSEGYEVVADLTRYADGRPRRIVVRAAQLRDYLCARGMGLYVNSYRNRLEVVSQVQGVDWPKEGKR